MVRSSRPGDIIKDIERKLERTINSDLDEINKLIKANTPVKSGFAKAQWRKLGQYKLGVFKKMFENTATYIAILDAGSYGSKYGPKRGSMVANLNPHKGPSRPIARDGIVAPAFEKVLTRRRKLN